MISLGVAVDIAGAILFLALAAFVATRRPRHAANVDFATFAAAMGATYVVVNIAYTSSEAWIQHAALGGGAVLQFAAAVAFVRMGRRFPRPLGPEERRGLWWAAPLALLVGAPTFDLLLRAPSLAAANGFVPTVLPTYRVYILTSFTITAAASYVGFVWVVRFRRAADDAAARIYALLGVSVIVILGANTGAFILGYTLGGPLLQLSVVVLALPLILLWLHATTLGPDRERRRMARNVALVVTASYLLGMLGVVLSGGYGPFLSSGALGVVRAISIVVTAYAILRHQMLGLDVKVRWTISKSTIAAAFVAVFFLASEGAQLLFGQGNEVVGLLAAGALVFAMAPLQRAADRLAERAVPSAPAANAPVAATPAGEITHARAYRAAVRAGLRDGVITPREEEHLADVAQELGIGARDALRLRREVEEEVPERH